MKKRLSQKIKHLKNAKLCIVQDSDGPTTVFVTTKIPFWVLPGALALLAGAILLLLGRGRREK